MNAGILCVISHFVSSQRFGIFGLIPFASVLPSFAVGLSTKHNKWRKEEKQVALVTSVNEHSRVSFYLAGQVEPGGRDG